MVDTWNLGSQTTGNLISGNPINHARRAFRTTMLRIICRNSWIKSRVFDCFQLKKRINKFESNMQRRLTRVYLCDSNLKKAKLWYHEWYIMVEAYGDYVRIFY